MSMLSAQSDELCVLADELRQIMEYSADWTPSEAVTLSSSVDVMREAADTIWELRNKLADLIDVDLVRCMDCEWFTNSSHYGAYCTNFGSPLHDDYEGFCAWAKRKEDGDGGAGRAR